MTPLKRRLAAVGAPLLLAVSLTACGGGAGGAPDDASSDKFCAAFNDDAADGDDVDAIHKFADKLKDIGTPKGISDKERNGFEKYIEITDDVSEDDIKKFDDADADPEDIFGDDAKDVEAFIAYVSKTCADQLTGE